MNEGQPAQPANMENIVAINQGWQEEPMAEPSAPLLPAQMVAQRVAEGHLVLDTRDEDAFGAGHMVGAFNVQLTSGQFEQRVGWVLPSKGQIILVTEDNAAAQEALHKLAFVGLQRRVAAVLDGGMASWLEAGLPMGSVPQMTVQELRKEMGEARLQIVDVRDESEWVSGHIAGALNIPYRQLAESLPGELDRQGPVAVLCSGGQRSSIAASVLLRQGFKDVRNVTGGMDAYEAADRAEVS